MAKRLDGKVAIVTGAGLGIGRGIAAVLAASGARVVIANRDRRPTGDGAAQAIRDGGGDAIAIRCDVSQERDVTELVRGTVAHYGRLDILVNNAAIGVYKTIEDLTSEEWDLCLGTNLKGSFLCSKYALPELRRAGGGSIVNIASVHAFRTTASCSPYAVTKAGQIALVRTMALDYARERIRVNAVCPGWTRSALVQGIFDASGDPVRMERTVAERQPMGRIGEPEDIGKAVAFLCSDDASFITGATLVVDGGLLALLEGGAGAGSEETL
ncbi:MAG: glucose 1-dehydrogenase [Chloroflexota bacterium]|nr:MAG: glucose 1-dehydrogenase [Chloroflexota bacterium]